MKSITKICLILTAALALASLPANAQSTNTATNAAPASRQSARPDYRGKISAVDSVNMILTVTGKTGDFKVKVTSKTRITKNRQPATFADAAEGSLISGRGTKDADGNWEATTLRLNNSPAKGSATAPGQ
jgi:hypothetical protein